MAIYKENIVDIDLENANIHRTFLKHTIGEGDSNANRFGVRVFRDGEPVDMSSVTCMGYFIRSDGGTVTLPGTVAGSSAHVTLTSACYAVEGQFALAIKLSDPTGEGVTGTMRIIDGVVSNTMTGTYIDPGTILPSIEELIATIEAAVASIPEDYSSLVNDFNYTAERAKTTEWVKRVGVVSGVLQDDGTVAASDSYKTTEFIPVNAGEKYVVSVTGMSSGVYTLYRCTYNASKQLVEYVLLEAENQRDWLIPDGVSYARFSVSNTSYNNGFSFRIKVDEFDLVDAATTGIDILNETIRCIDYAKRYGFTQGRLSTENGTVDISDAGLVTIADFIPVKTGDSLMFRVPKATSGFTLWRAFYDKNKNFITGVSFDVTTNFRRYTVMPGISYVKYCISKAAYDKTVSVYIENDVTDGEFHLMSLPVKNETHGYTGENLPLQIKNKAKWAKLFYFDDTGPSGKTQQGIAISGSVLFQFMDSDLVQLFDIGNRGAMISQFALTCGHGNTAVFSDEYDTIGDEFPLCYVSDVDGNVYCNRITRSGATLIKTLYFDESVYGYAPQFTLDTDNNICYTVANKVSGSEMHTAVISKFNMANMTQNQDSTYTPEFIEKFEIEIPGTYPVLQGAKYLNGHLFLPSGAHGDTVDAFITVIDIDNRRVSSRITDLPAAVAKKEMEDVAFMPNPFSDNYDMVVYFRMNGYYRLSI